MAQVAIIAAAAIGAVAKGGSAMNEANSRAAAAEYNAGIARQNANLARAQGEEEARRARIMGKKAVGDQRASYAASGVGIEGSALDVLEETASNSELNALTAKQRGDAQGWAYDNQARLEKLQEKNARTQGWFAAASALTGGVVSAASAGGGGGGSSGGGSAGGSAGGGGGGGAAAG